MVTFTLVHIGIMYNKPNSREVIGQSDTLLHAFDLLRLRLINRNNLLIDTPHVPEVIKQLAHDSLPRLLSASTKFRIDEDGVVSIDGVPPQMDYYQVEIGD